MPAIGSGNKNKQKDPYPQNGSFFKHNVDR
jgi:hypothetical protein